MTATPTTWTPQNPEPAAWIPRGSGTVSATNEGVIRLLQDGTQRLEQDGLIARTLQPNVVTGKIPTTWEDTP